MDPFWIRSFFLKKWICIVTRWMFLSASFELVSWFSALTSIKLRHCSWVELIIFVRFKWFFFIFWHWIYTLFIPLVSFRTANYIASCQLAAAIVSSDKTMGDKISDTILSAYVPVLICMQALTGRHVSLEAYEGSATEKKNWNMTACDSHAWSLVKSDALVD